MQALAEWQNFYMIAGSAAGALIGLQFVVLTLLANMPRRPNLSQGAGAYSTPTIVHYSTVLLLSAAVSAPWRSLVPIAALLGTAGLSGAGYSIVNVVRIRRAAYRPNWEDWLFHALLPLAGYALLAASSVGVLAGAAAWLFGVAGVTALLLVIGIHNAWDTVTYHVFSGPAGADEH